MEGFVGKTCQSLSGVKILGMFQNIDKLDYFPPVACRQSRGIVLGIITILFDLPSFQLRVACIGQASDFRSTFHRTNPTVTDAVP